MEKVESGENCVCACARESTGSNRRIKGTRPRDNPTPQLNHAVTSSDINRVGQEA